jgi:SAM-dependent methyltransferase
MMQNKNSPSDLKVPRKDILGRRRLLVRRLLNGKPGRILDIGCQSGEMSGALLKDGFEVFGIDIVEDLISRARQRCPEAHFSVADCEKEIPFAENYFDYVWAGDVIEHIRFTDKFLNEINRVLKVGGLFALSTPMHNAAKNVLIALFRFEEHYNPEFPHLRFYTAASLKRVLLSHGFVVEQQRFLGRIRPIANTMLVLSRKERDEKRYNKYAY